MLVEEAKWLGRHILSIESVYVFPMLNVGSSTGKFRKKEQPWIDEYIFRPIREKTLEVVHTDGKNAPGVDIVGDLSDQSFLQELAKAEFRSVLCSNLLEHVSDRNQVGRSLVSIVPTGGYLFVSCPYSYPHHADPIDTMFRPNVHELASVFPGTCIIHAAIVSCGTHLDYLALDLPVPEADTIGCVSASNERFGGKKQPGLLDSIIYSLKGMHWHLRNLPWLFKGYQATCLVLRKHPESPSSPA